MKLSPNSAYLCQDIVRSVYFSRATSQKTKQKGYSEIYNIKKRYSEILWIELWYLYCIKGVWPDHFFDHPTYLNFFKISEQAPLKKKQKKKSGSWGLVYFDRLHSFSLYFAWDVIELELRVVCLKVSAQ